MIILKSRREIEKMKKSNALVAAILEELRKKIKPGVKTIELDRLSEEMALKKGARPAFKGYRGYPYSLCTSVNSEVVHGMPSERELKEGDIISLDFGILHGGYYGDAAVTVPVGQITPAAKRLLAVTEEALYRGIAEARAGNRIGDISAAIQGHAEAAGFSVVRDLVGHGIGRSLHEDPQVPNYGTSGRGIELKTGMVFAIEPMVNEGTYRVDVLRDGWTVVTADGKLSAHFEHSVAITENGPVILSRIG
ncbi:MAG: type I methionyl aminopeptidase [Pseudomonadota bacterium]|jgi:methionyl aminopeptidase|nr:type I methionyl aminopeptidase [Pseudomonadota bacterium]NLX31795.1 type I methionyl aminopeptidase [Deltaproteobacteria bacterium]HNU84364.1 type I methionyl aminopeptidase [Syntrophales bacterium]HNZ34579.1 type I methionyl aminopeptidase [Syntrophales bacterium]HOF73462.1 type I methionyl aminopeptidase [Syntrophales bacterium]